MGASTVSTVLRCLSKAPKLPALDWGVIIRRCMRYDLHSASEVHMRHALASHREECLNFCLSHASHVSSLLSLVDELSELPRFKTLELNMQKFLLEHLSNICKIFSGQRLEKLFVDLAEYFSDPSSSYLAYGAEKKILLRVAFWKGLHQCFRDDSKELIMISNAEKCLASLLSLLPISGCSGFSEEGTIGEWSVAIQCLSEAPKDWLLDLLQVPNARVHGERIPFVAKMICIKAKLVGIGCLTISDLAELKSHILNEKTEGVRWSMLIEVVAALLTAEGRVKRQWLLDAVEISCISEYPSTALYFVGLLSSGCCMYMPLLIADPTSVLSDLPVTLPSLMSINAWSTIAGTLVDKLWICTERICKWVKHLSIAGSEASTKTYHIDASEACLSVFLARVLHGTCLSLKEFLPFDKQLGLANLEEVL